MSIYTIYTEKEQSQGRVDCIVETDKYIYIFEFKLDGTAEAALQQIEDKGYARPYGADPRKLYRIGAIVFLLRQALLTIGRWEGEATPGIHLLCSVPLSV